LSYDTVSSADTYGILLFLCSEEEKLKKLGDLMNESHYSCSVLYECRYLCSILNY
jgi:galactokinase